MSVYIIGDTRFTQEDLLNTFPRIRKLVQDQGRFLFVLVEQTNPPVYKCHLNLDNMEYIFGANATGCAYVYSKGCKEGHSHGDTTGLDEIYCKQCLPKTGGYRNVLYFDI